MNQLNLNPTNQTDILLFVLCLFAGFGFFFFNTGFCLQSGQFYDLNEMQPFSRLTAGFHLRKLIQKVPVTPVLINNQTLFPSLLFRQGLEPNDL